MLSVRSEHSETTGTCGDEVALQPIPKVIIFTLDYQGKLGCQSAAVTMLCSISSLNG